MDLHQNLIVVVRASLLNQKQEALKETQHLPQGKERNNSDKSAVKQPAKSNIYTAVMNVITIKHLYSSDECHHNNMYEAPNQIIPHTCKWQL